MRTFKKRDFPLSEIRRFLEPGPIVLVSSAWNGAFHIMTMSTPRPFTIAATASYCSSATHLSAWLQTGGRSNLPSLEEVRT